MAEHVRLREYVTTGPLAVTAAEHTALTSAGVAVTQVYGTRGLCNVRPGSTVGVVRVGDRQFNIAPKIGIARLLHLLSWSLSDEMWSDELAEFGDESSLLEVMAAAFARQLERTLARGVVRGYRNRRERGFTVRGRIDLAAQLRREHGRMLPINIACDDHTIDTDANRLLLAAIRRLRGVRLRSASTRRRLVRARDRLDGVTPIRFDRRHLPPAALSGRDAHYRPALALARLVLQGLSIEIGGGGNRADSVLFDMNDVFEKFVIRSLRDLLGLSAASFPSNDGRLRLDEGRRVRLEPDLSWIDSGRPIFVGDVKYKRVDVRGVTHPDLYQVHAYARAAGLPSALLVYAKGEGVSTLHDVVLGGPQIEVVAVDLDRDVAGIDHEMRRVAARVRDHARRGRLQVLGAKMAVASTTDASLAMTRSR